MRVPVIDKPQVNQEALPDVQSRLDFRGTDGEAIAQGVRQLGQGVEQAGEHIDRAQDFAATLEANNGVVQFKQAGNSALYGNPGPGTDAAAVAGAGAGPGGAAGAPPKEVPPQGILNTQGLNAAKASAHALEYLQNQRQAIASGLSSDRARAKFLESTAGEMLGYHRDVEQHVFQQTRVAAQESTKATVALSLNDIGNHYSLEPGDEARSQQALATGEKSIRDMGAAQGMPKEAVDVQVQAFQAQAAETRLDKLLADKDYKSAQTLFSRTQDVLGDKGAHYQHSIAILKEHREGDDLALQLSKDATTPSGLVDVPKLIAAANSLPEEKRTESFKESLRSQLHLASETNQQTASQYHTRAMSKYEETGSLHAIDPQDAAWLIKNDPQAWAAIKDRAYADAQRVARGIPSEKENKDLSEGQVVLYAQAVDKLNGASAEDLKSWTPEQITHDFYGKLPQKQLMEIVHLATEKRGAKVAGAGSDEALSGPEHATLLQGLRASQVLGSADKNNPSGWTLDAARIFAVVTDDVAKRKAAMLATGKKPDLEDIERWRDESLASTTIKKGWFSDTKVPYADFKSNPAYAGKQPIVEPGEVPHDDEVEIREHLAAKGIKHPSDDQVRAMYQASGRGRPAPSAAPVPATPEASATPAPDLVHPFSHSILDAAETISGVRAARWAANKFSNIKPSGLAIAEEQRRAAEHDDSVAARKRRESDAAEEKAKQDQARAKEAAAFAKDHPMGTFHTRTTER